MQTFNEILQYRTSVQYSINSHSTVCLELLCMHADQSERASHFALAVYRLITCNLHFATCYLPTAINCQVSPRTFSCILHVGTSPHPAFYTCPPYYKEPISKALKYGPGSQFYPAPTHKPYLPLLPKQIKGVVWLCSGSDTRNATRTRLMEPYTRHESSPFGHIHTPLT